MARFLGYLALTVFIPAVGLVMGGASMAKRAGRRKLQGMILFVVANLSIIAYGALFTVIVAHRK